MAIAEQDRAEFVNQVGYEAFQHIVKRMEELGPMPFKDMFPLVADAATVCIANVLGPAIEASPDRIATADGMMQASWQQLKTLLGPLVEAQLQQRPGGTA